jgi:hypothetical protein
MFSENSAGHKGGRCSGTSAKAASYFPDHLQLKLKAIHKTMNLYKGSGFVFQTATFL